MPEALQVNLWSSKLTTTEEREQAFERIRIEAAEILIDSGAIGFDFDPEKGFPFKSGIVSPMYMDCRVLPYKPGASERVGKLMHEYLTLRGVECDLVAGVAQGGSIPAYELAQHHLGVPNVTVRDDKKGHGTQSQIQGGNVEGSRVLVVDDTVTMGTATFPAIETLRRAGAVVTDLMSITTYGFSKTSDRFREAGVTHHSLTNAATVVEVALKRGQIGGKEAGLVLEWLKEQDKNNVGIP